LFLGLFSSKFFIKSKVIVTSRLDICQKRNSATAVFEAKKFYFYVIRFESFGPKIRQCNIFDKYHVLHLRANAWTDVYSHKNDNYELCIYMHECSGTVLELRPCLSRKMTIKTYVGTRCASVLDNYYYC